MFAVVRRAIRRFWTWVWLSEWIPLGRLAPHVLGWSLGSKPHRVVEPENDYERMLEAQQYAKLAGEVSLQRLEEIKTLRAWTDKTERFLRQLADDPRTLQWARIKAEWLLVGRKDSDDC